MTDRRVLGIIVFVVGIVLGLSVARLYINLSFQVPPPSHLPRADPEIIVTDELTAWARATYQQDFMPIIRPEGPPFFISVTVSVTNTGNSTISSFEVPRVTIYFNGTRIPLVTLNLRVVEPDTFEIGPNETIVVKLANNRETIFSPTIEEGTALYSRVLTRWGDGSEMILTTPPSRVCYTF
ncbi:MAG: hypothetical protein ACFFDQ_12975 [Candidatus Thorarchaeota archaeon]